jgi:hypothetical protein
MIYTYYKIYESGEISDKIHYPFYMKPQVNIIQTDSQGKFVWVISYTEKEAREYAVGIFNRAFS